MVKALSYFRRRPELTVEAFQDYWRSSVRGGTHLPASAGTCRSQGLALGVSQGPPLYDGIAESGSRTPPCARSRAPRHTKQSRPTRRLHQPVDHGAPHRRGARRQGRLRADRRREERRVRDPQPGMEVEAFTLLARAHGPLATTIPTIRATSSHLRRSAYEAGAATWTASPSPGSTTPPPCAPPPPARHTRPARQSRTSSPRPALHHPREHVILAPDGLALTPPGRRLCSRALMSPSKARSQ